MPFESLVIAPNPDLWSLLLMAASTLILKTFSGGGRSPLLLLLFSGDINVICL